MNPPRFLIAKIALVSVLGAALFGFGMAVASRDGGRTSLIGTAAAPAATPEAEGNEIHRHGPHGLSPMAALGVLAKDTGKSPMDIFNALKSGQTLDQIAGANDAKVKADALAVVKKGLDSAVSKGALTSAQETSLLADAKDAIDQIMAAKLGVLIGQKGGLPSL